MLGVSETDSDLITTVGVNDTHVVGGHMSVHRSPFERLRAKFDESELECRHCGCRDNEGGWRVTTTGSRVQYQFVCPTCGAVETKEMRL